MQQGMVNFQYDDVSDDKIFPFSAYIFCLTSTYFLKSEMIFTDSWFTLINCGSKMGYFIESI